MRTDPVSSAGGGTDLRRMQLRWSHHISTLTIVHCRQPLSSSGHYTRRKEGEHTTEVEAKSVRVPRVLVRSHIWAWTDEDLPPIRVPGLDKTSPWTQAHQAGNPPQLQIRLLEPGGNHGATSKCSDFADEEAEAQTSEESCTRSQFWTKLYRTAFDSL